MVVSMPNDLLVMLHLTQAPACMSKQVDKQLLDNILVAQHSKPPAVQASPIVTQQTVSDQSTVQPATQPVLSDLPTVLPATQQTVSNQPTV